MGLVDRGNSLRIRVAGGGDGKRSELATLDTRGSNERKCYMKGHILGTGKLRCRASASAHSWALRLAR